MKLTDEPEPMWSCGALASGTTPGAHFSAAFAVLLQSSTVIEPIRPGTGIGWKRQRKGEN